MRGSVHADTGKYNPVEGTADEASCHDCALAKSSTYGAPECFLLCTELGQFFDIRAGGGDTHASYSCTPCSAGTSLSALGKTEAASCLVCSAGMIAPNASAAFCTVCPQGYYANKASTACLECEAGFQCSTGVKTPCTNNTLSLAAQTNCAACKPGEVPDAAGTSCVECDRGFSAGVGAGVCVACGPGEFAKTAGSVYCLKARAGHRPNADRTAEVQSVQ